MVRFDWEKILSVTQGDIGYIITIFQALSFGDTPDSLKDPLQRFSGLDFYGHSFLVNPMDLIFSVETGEHSPKEAAEYIAVASLRSIHDLRERDVVYLPLRLFPQNPDILKDNRLIKLDSDKILFKYEFDRLGIRRNK